MFALLDVDVLGVEAAHPFQVAQVGRRFFLCLVGSTGEVRLQELVAFFGSGGGDVAFFLRQGGGFGGTRFHAGVLRRVDVAQALGGDGLLRQLPRGTVEQGLVAHRFGQGIRFAGKDAQADVVMHRHVGGECHCLRRCQFAKLLQHDVIGHIVDGILWPLRRQQRLHHRIAAVVKGVAVFVLEEFGDKIRMHPARFAHFAPQLFDLRFAVAEFEQGVMVKAQGRQVMQVRVFPRLAAAGVGLVQLAVLRLPALLRAEDVVEIVEAVVVVEIALFHQRLPHAVHAEAAIAPQHREAGADVGDAVCGVEPPFLLHRVAVQPAQFGDGGVEVVMRRVHRVRPRAAVASNGGVGGHCAGKELPNAVHRQVQDHLPRLHFCLLPRGFGFLLFAAQCLVAQAADVPGITQGTRLHFILRRLRRIPPLLLVFGELFRRHPRFFGVLKQLHHAAVLLRQFDSVTGCQHAVKNLPHFVVERGVEVTRGFVDAQQPGTETLERALQFQRRCLAFEDVGFKLPRRQFVVAAFFFQGHAVPAVKAGDTEIGKDGVGVLDDLLLSVGQRFACVMARAQFAGMPGKGFKEVVAEFVDEGGEVGVRGQGDGVGIRAEGTARGGLFLQVLAEGLRRVFLQGCHMFQQRGRIFLAWHGMFVNTESARIVACLFVRPCPRAFLVGEVGAFLGV